MLRSKLTTKDGLSFIVEAQNPEHLLKILDRVSHGDQVTVQMNENVPTVQHVTINEKKTATRASRRGRGYGPRWSEKDIVSVAKIVRDNVHLQTGLSPLARKYLKNHGDYKNRTDATIYTIVSDYKKYFTGENIYAVPKKTRKTLEKNGLYPNTDGKATDSFGNSVRGNYIGEVRKISVVEA